MRNYKITKCRLENLKKGDRVLSKYMLSGNHDWYSFTFVEIKHPLVGIEGVLRVTGTDNQFREYLFEDITTFYKVEDDFPNIYGDSIDHLNLNIGG